MTGEFRNGTLDQAIFNGVAVRNEYRLPARFAASDIIIDIGAHIGSFAQAVLSQRLPERLRHRSGRREFRDRGGIFATLYRQR